MKVIFRVLFVELSNMLIELPPAGLQRKAFSVIQLFSQRSSLAPMVAAATMKITCQIRQFKSFQRMVNHSKPI